MRINILYNKQYTFHNLLVEFIMRSLGVFRYDDLNGAITLSNQCDSPVVLYDDTNLHNDIYMNI